MADAGEDMWQRQNKILGIFYVDKEELIGFKADVD